MGEVIKDIGEKWDDKELFVHSIPGHSFNLFFKDIEDYIKSSKNLDYEWRKDIESTDKRDIIIFSPGINKINSYELGKKKLIFPFDNIFVEYPLKMEKNHIKHFSYGFLLKAVRNEKEEIYAILVNMVWLDWGVKKGEEGVTPNIMLIPYDLLNQTIDKLKLKNNSHLDNELVLKIFTIMKKIVQLVQNKDYSSYFKWTPLGVTQNKIVYSHDVRSHKRHFWRDSGRFKISFLSKAEAILRGYEIDDLVFRGNELRRDVPYKIIDTFTVGKDKEKKEDNRIIRILKGKILRNETKLGKILLEIFPNEIIRHNKTFSKNSRLRLDYCIWKKRLAFEYDGEQHFDKDLYKKLYGDGFDEQVKRDKKKNKLCKKKNITLIRIKYDEPLTKSHIKNKLKEKVRRAK